MGKPKAKLSKTCLDMRFCIILLCIAALFETAFLGLTIQVWNAQSIFFYIGLAFVLQIAACLKAIYIRHISCYSIKPMVYIGCGVITGLLTYSALEVSIGLTMMIANTVPAVPILPNSLFIASLDALLSIVLLYGIKNRLKIMLQSQSMQLSRQIRHHFLFNTLNTTVCRIKKNPELAQANLERLAELFSKILLLKSYINLEEELAFVKCYLEIEKYRLRKRLKVDWFFNYETNIAIKVPALTLQPLVENAIHHGIERIIDGGTIVISIYTVRNRLIIQVCNPIGDTGLSDLSAGNHIAQNNIERRLIVIYGDDFSFEREKSETEYRSTINIPMGELL